MKKFFDVVFIMMMVATAFIGCKNTGDSDDFEYIMFCTCPNCHTVYGTVAEKEKCGKSEGCPAYKYVCPHCNGAYATKAEMENCDKTYKCPEYYPHTEGNVRLLSGGYIDGITVMDFGLKANAIIVNPNSSAVFETVNKEDVTLTITVVNNSSKYVYAFVDDFAKNNLSSVYSYDNIIVTDNYPKFVTSSEFTNGNPTVVKTASTVTITSN